MAPVDSCTPDLQKASENLLGEALAQHIREKIDSRGDHPRSHYSLTGSGVAHTGTAHVSVLGEDGSAVAATSTINTPCVGSGREGPLLPKPPQPSPLSLP